MREKYSTFVRYTQKKFGVDIEYFIRGGFWTTLSQLFVAFSGILLAAAFANILSKNDYGVYKYVISIISLLAVFTLPGMNSAVTRSIARGFDGAYKAGIIYSALFGLIGSLAAIGFAGYYFHKGDTFFTLIFLLVAPLIPLFGSFTIYASFLNGKRLYKQLSLFQNTKQVITVIVTLLVLLLTKNLLLLVVTYVLLSIVVDGFFALRVLKKYKPNNIQEPKTYRYGFHLSIMKGLEIVIGAVQNILLVQVSGVVALAVYALVAAPVEQIRGFNRILPTLLLPKVAQQGWQLPSFSALAKKLLLPIGSMTAIVILYILVAPLLYRLLFPLYPEAIFYSQLFSIGLIPTLVNKIFDSILRAQGKTQSLYLMLFFSFFFQATVVISSIYFFGLAGIVIGTLLYKFCMSITYILLLYIPPQKFLRSLRLKVLTQT